MLRTCLMCEFSVQHLPVHEIAELECLQTFDADNFQLSASKKVAQSAGAPMSPVRGRCVRTKEKMWTLPPLVVRSLQIYVRTFGRRPKSALAMLVAGV